jgi:fibronectin-binding autotransporter adhesin
VRIGSFLSITGGAGPDTVNITDTTIGQNVAFNLGSGTNKVTLDSTSIQGNTTSADSGTETITTQNNTEFTGGVSIQDAPIPSGSFSFSNTSFGSYLSLRAGGADSVTMSGCTVLQNTALNLGNGADTVTIDSSAFHGAVTVGTGSSADSIAFTKSSVGGATTFSIGAGDDTLDVGDATFVGATTINGGAGNKTINLEDGETDKFNTTFFGPFSLLDPTGKVTLTLGSDANDLDIFWNTVVLQGNSNSKLNTPVLADFFGGAPTGSPAALLP